MCDTISDKAFGLLTHPVLGFWWAQSARETTFLNLTLAEIDWAAGQSFCKQPLGFSKGKVCAGQQGFTVNVRGQASSARWLNHGVEGQADVSQLPTLQLSSRLPCPLLFRCFVQVLIYPFCSPCVSEEGGSPFHITFCTVGLFSLITMLVQEIILDMDSWTSSVELRILEVLPKCRILAK